MTTQSAELIIFPFCWNKKQAILKICGISWALLLHIAIQALQPSMILGSNLVDIYLWLSALAFPVASGDFLFPTAFCHFWRDRAWIFVKGKSKCKRFFYFIPERPLHLFGLWESLVAVRYQLQTKDGSFGRKAYTPHLRCPTWLLILPLLHEATEKTEG